MDEESSKREIKNKKRERKIIICDVFLSDPPLIDRFVYSQWLAGSSVSEAASMKTQNASELSSYKRYVGDQYNNFVIMERFLKCPPRLNTQTAFVITPTNSLYLLQEYYKIDKSIMPRLFPKKFKLQYSQMEELGRQNPHRFRAVKRLFKNLRRIFHTVVSFSSTDQPVSSVIQREYMIPTRLVNEYVRVCFLAHYQFETSRKKTNFLLYPDFEALAKVLIQLWSRNGVAIDPSLSIVKEVKGILSSQTQGAVKSQVIQTLKGDKNFCDVVGQIDAKFSTLLKGLVHYTTCLSQDKEMRSFFTEFLEKIPVKYLTKELLQTLFKTIEECVESHFASHPQKRELTKEWPRFLDGILGCSIIIVEAHRRHQNSKEKKEKL